MNWTNLPLWLAVAAVLCAVGVVVYDRCRTKATLRRLDDMLDAAIRGDFTEDSFDESMLSAVETRLAQYLATSAMAADNLAAEKDKLKVLIGDISHQTKTPISNLLLYTQLLQEQPLPPQSAGLLAALCTQTEKLHFLIEALVKVSRLESGVLAVCPQDAPLQPVLDRALAQVRPRAAAKNIVLNAPKTDLRAALDEKWTAEALFNVLDNAIKYTPAGGRVTVRTAAYDLFCRVDVCDTGPGIPEAEQAKIFGRFYRAPAVHDAEGVGIGLYLARQILAEQGGYLKVSSVLGQGSVFSLFLPSLLLPRALPNPNLSKL